MSTNKILAYEFITGGGCFSLAEPIVPSGSLYQEGLAMLRAVVSDLAAMDDVEVHYLRDERLPEIDLLGCVPHVVHSVDVEHELLTRLVRECEQTLVVAPEFEQALVHRVKLVEQISPARLLSPGSSFVAVATDKSGLADRLKRFGIRTPHGLLVPAGAAVPTEFQFPAVLKPNDGAGSQQTQLVADAEAASRLPPMTQPMRMERLCEGLACSVSVICADRRRWALPTFEQLLSNDGLFAYQGGRRMMNEAFVMRTQRLALNALAAMPSAFGYVGVDIILGDRTDGTRDFVIEINPRLTTSYIGLRAISKTNLAEAMRRVASGAAPRLGFRDSYVEFTADGRLQ